MNHTATLAAASEVRHTPTQIAGLGATVATPLWRPWRVTARGSDYVLDQLGYPSTRSHLVELAQEIVAAEGPALRSRVARLIANAHGLQRVSAKRTAEIGSVVGAGFKADEEGSSIPPRLRRLYTPGGAARYPAMAGQSTKSASPRSRTR
jgi:hypothetical protein